VIDTFIQLLELFEDATALDNLRVASNPRDGTSYAVDLVYPVQPLIPRWWPPRSGSSS